MVALLHDGGIHIERIAQPGAASSTASCSRACGRLLAPADLVANSCLLVMGSEGRGEQILKTDQDNALLLRDGFATAGARAEVAERFNAALIEFGYPPCPGNIMLSNPLWRQPLSRRSSETLRDWMYGADPTAPMHLAIFFDAAAVAGDAGLLRAGARATSTTSWPATTPSSPASRRRRPVRRARRLVGAPGGRAPRRTAVRPEEARHLPDRARRARARLQHHVREIGTAARLRALVDRAAPADADWRAT